MEFQEKYNVLLDYMQKNDPQLEKITQKPIYTKIKECLHKIKTMGYRTKILNSWEGVLEWKVYGYMQYEGLSPFSNQNFPYQNYKIHQINALHFPMRMEFELDKSLLYDNPESKEIIKYENPFDIRNLPKESKHLHLMLEKFPISIVSADIGILSKRKFVIIDLYSQGSVIEGEVTGDQYEFHILRFEKIFAKDEKRYRSELDYQRFVDVNFKHEMFNWLIADVDQYLHHLPIGSN